MPEEKIKLLDRRLFEIKPPGGFCGIYVPEHIMKKLKKLETKYYNEVRKTLTEHKAEIYPKDWTCATEKKPGGRCGKQIILYFTYAEGKDPCDTKQRRIDTFKPAPPEYNPEVWLADSRETAKKQAEANLRAELGDDIEIT